MTAAIDTMAWFQNVPWHGLGVELNEEDTYSIDRCIDKSGLGWTVELRQCYVDIESEENGLIKTPIDSYATMRGDKILGIVGGRYEILQNHEAFQIFQPFLDNKLVRLNTAGSLFGGEKVWILAEIMGEPLRITDEDIVRKFILLSHGHTGKDVVRFGLSPIRVVCANTLAMAIADNMSKLIRMKHTKNILNNLESVREIIDLVNQDFKATQIQYQRLLNSDISQQDVEKYIKRVLDIPDKDISTRQYNIIQKIRDYFNIAPGNDVKGIRGTLWAGFNAITYYFSHEYGRNQENRLESNWWGKGAETTKKALDIALEEFTEDK